MLLAGGFFCAVFTKVASAGSEDPDAIDTDTHTTQQLKPPPAPAPACPTMSEPAPCHPHVSDSTISNEDCSFMKTQPTGPTPLTLLPDAAPRAVPIQGRLFYNNQIFHELSADSAEGQRVEQFYGTNDTVSFFSFTDKSKKDRRIVAVSPLLRHWLQAYSANVERKTCKVVQLTTFGVRVFKVMTSVSFSQGVKSHTEIFFGPTTPRRALSLRHPKYTRKSLP